MIVQIIGKKAARAGEKATPLPAVKAPCPQKKAKIPQRAKKGAGAGKKPRNERKKQPPHGKEKKKEKIAEEDPDPQPKRLEEKEDRPSERGVAEKKTDRGAEESEKADFAAAEIVKQDQKERGRNSTKDKILRKKKNGAEQGGDLALFAGPRGREKRERK